MIAMGVFAGAGFNVYFPIACRVYPVQTSLFPTFFPAVAVTSGSVMLGERLLQVAFTGLVLASTIAATIRVLTGQSVSAAAPPVPKTRRGQPS